MGINKPSKIIDIAGELAIEKDAYSIKKIGTLSFLAGAYIAFGGLLSIIVGGGVPGIAAENPGIAKLLFGAAFPRWTHDGGNGRCRAVYRKQCLFHAQCVEQKAKMDRAIT